MYVFDVCGPVDSAELLVVARPPPFIPLVFPLPISVVDEELVNERFVLDDVEPVPFDDVTPTVSTPLTRRDVGLGTARRLEKLLL